MSYIQNKLDEELFKLTFWNKITIAEQESLRFFCLAMNKDYHNHIMEILKEIISVSEKISKDIENKYPEYIDEYKKLLSILQDTNPKE